MINLSQMKRVPYKKQNLNCIDMGLLSPGGQTNVGNVMFSSLAMTFAEDVLPNQSSCCKKPLYKAL